MKSPSDPVQWLAALAAVAGELPREEQRRPYFSQRATGLPSSRESSLPAVVHRVRSLIHELHQEHYFAKTFGFDCCDGNGESDSSPAWELERRVGKPHLWSDDSANWSESDLADFIEVFHDLAARPTSGWFHSYSGCGWHPTTYSPRAGQALYRWRVNELLNTTALGLRLAESGEDTGRMVRAVPGEVGRLVDEMLDRPATHDDGVAHAVALFRSRTGTRAELRSAIVELAGILEERRALLRRHLLSKDEDALFQIANRYDLRHRNTDQRNDYHPAFLKWIFYWYLATVQLTDELLSAQSGVDQEPPD